MNKQSVAEKQYQKFDNGFESNKEEEVKTKSKRSCGKSNLLYNNYFTFNKYNNIKELAKCSFDSKLDHLKKFKDKLELFYYDSIEVKANDKDQIKSFEKRKTVFDTALELYIKLTKAQKKRIKVQNVREKLPINLYLDEDDLPPTPALKDDEEVKLQPEETIAE